MKFYLSLLILLIAGQPVFAQEVVLKGKILVPGETINYDIHLTEEYNGTFTGYSLAYLNPQNDTRAVITGKIDRKAKTLSFTELSIEYSNGFNTMANICRINAVLNFKSEITSGRPALTGVLSTPDAAYERCATGTMVFNASSDLTALFNKTDVPAPSRPVVAAVIPPATPTSLLKQPVKAVPAAPDPLKKDRTTSGTVQHELTISFNDTVRKSAVVVQSAPAPSIGPQSAEITPGSQDGRDEKTYPIANNPRSVVVAPDPKPQRVTPMFKSLPPAPAPINHLDTAGGRHVTDTSRVNLQWQSDTLVVDIWDGGMVDGDEVTVMFNNQLYYSRYSLTAVKATLKIPLKGSGGVLHMLAVYCGTEGANNVNMELHDRNATYRFVAINYVGHEVKFNINRAMTP